MADDYDVAIAGGGIAALTAAVHSARMGRSTLVLGGRAPGGLLLSIERIDGVPGFPEGVAGYELCPMLQEQAADDGAEVRMAELEGLEPDGRGVARATSDGEVAGAGRDPGHRRPPEDARRRGRGAPAGPRRQPLRELRRAAACATARSASCGGGDSALQEALTLADAVGEVIVLHRGDALTRAGRLPRAASLAHPKISVRYGIVVEEILGEDAVERRAHARRRRRATRRTSSSAACSSTSGCEPNSELPARPARRSTTTGASRPTPRCRPSSPGVFAAGIVRSGSLGQAAISAGEGAAAAKAAHRHLAASGAAASTAAAAAAPTATEASHG